MIDAVELAKREHIAEEAEKAVKRPEINLACAALLRSRQLYYMARNELTFQLEALDTDVLEDVESVLVQSMAAKAEEGFDSSDLLKAMGQELLIFVHKAHIRLSQVETEAGTTEDRPESVEDETVILDGRPYLPGCSHVMYSDNRNKLNERLDAVVSSAIANNKRVLEFGLAAGAQIADRDTRRRHIVAPQNQWLNGVSSRASAAKLIKHWARQLSGEAADIIVVRDLARIGKSPIVGVEADWFTANSAHKILLDFARQSGVVLVCAIATAEDKPESVFPDHPNIFLENCDD